MKARSWLFAAAMSVAGLAMAQTATKSGVTETTDPAKIAEIERHAQQLASGTPTAPMAGERDHMQKDGMRHHMHKHGKGHHKNKAMHEDAMKDKAPSDTPMATESKK